jgi:hypothetical protein
MVCLASEESLCESARSGTVKSAVSAQARMMRKLLLEEVERYVVLLEPQLLCV